MANVHVRAIREGDEADVYRMMVALWPDEGIEDFPDEIARYIDGEPSTPIGGAIYVAERPSNEGLCGFIEVCLRSVAEDCWRHSPVGYIEGWWVDEDVRRQGVGAALVKAAEEWSLAQGCWDMASDALIDNTLSHQAHEGLGYEEVVRLVHFHKPLR